MIKLTKEKIDQIFEEAKDQGDYLIRLYKHAFPYWEKIKKIDDWPKVHIKTWLYITEKAISFDKIHHPNVLPGGLWLNNGFSSTDNIKPWHVDISEVKIIYEEN